MPETQLRPQPRVSYVTFPNASREHPLTIAGQLRVPMRDGNLSAVVVVHGTSGVDSRGSYHAQALNDAGIATLELDMWSPRGLSGGTGPCGRPEGVPETLPDAYGALLYLASRPGIDPQRIGITGYSWGGVVSMLTATRPYSELYMGGNPLRFAAHAPFYPVCWGYNKIPGYEFAELTGAPVFIQSGECDAYDQPDSCTELVNSLPEQARRRVTVTMYPEATHGFNRLEPPQTVNDPFAHLGQGGEVRFEANLDAAAKSRQATVDFFERAFAAVGQANN
ncbi:MAG: dienelactone hydrolase family protein [Rhodanobacter sp.]